MATSSRGVTEMLAGIRISSIYRALAGKEPRRSGCDTWRAPAVWRGGDGHSVSMDDARGVWHDFAADEGGGVLDLVVRVRGGSRRDALRWVADFTGRPLDDRRLSALERTRWGRQQQEIESELPKARLWRRTAVALGEQVLSGLKGELTDLTRPLEKTGEIAPWTARIAVWRQLDGANLVAEYLRWVERAPRFTGGMVYVAGMREKAEWRALNAYLSDAPPKSSI